MDLKHKRVALLGFGVENRGLINYLKQRESQITICDSNEDMTRDVDNVDYRLGDNYLSKLTDFDIVFRTPGLPYLTPQLQEAKKSGVVLSSQVELFMAECPAPIIGVTGTKGKGTTSSLIHAALTAAKRNGEISGSIHLAGNIGVSAISLLNTIQPSDWVVLELSSFQLQGLTRSPHIAVVLAITVDHLNHHKTVEEYHAAKRFIVDHQTESDFLVTHLDSPTSRSFETNTEAEVYYYSRLQSHIQGSFIESNQIILRLPNKPQQTVCPISDIKLVGAYNLENVTAATIASALAGASAESIREGITSFTGLHHRLEFVTEKQGVKYYDDSKATTPDSTLAAVQAFTQPTVLIIGGSSKGADFTEFIEAMKASAVTHVVCIGQEGGRIAQLLQQYNAPQQVIMGANTMKEIVHQAATVAQPGGVVFRRDLAFRQQLKDTFTFLTHENPPRGVLPPHSHGCTATGRSLGRLSLP